MKIKTKGLKHKFLPNLIGLVILHVVFTYILPSSCYDCNETLKEDILPLYVCGLISKKYYDKNHNYERLFYLEYDEEKYFHIQIGYAQHLWNAIEVGDSIFKEAGSDTVIVKHKKDNSYVIYKLGCKFGRQYEDEE